MSDVSSLNGKKIVIGVTGSIAAYKAADLIRRLKDFGTEVRVMMTTGAAEFITPLTLQTLSGHPVAMTLLDADEESAMGHIALARWADWILIAPATADCLSRLVSGRADDILAAVCLATEAPIAVAPAMNNKMWSNAATQSNLALLKQRGVSVIGPASGNQACGEQGEGRLLEPLDIIYELDRLMVPGLLAGKQVVITAGPTYEPIDPVRFIGNRSSGKMGFAIAQAAKEAGAKVTIIAGPVQLATPTAVRRINVETTEEMALAVEDSLDACDIFISCAAVSDYRPIQVQQEKIKKNSEQSIQIELEPTIDIVSTVTNRHNKPSFVVGFAAETQNLTEYAKSKLARKKLDMIAANLVGENQGFAVDDNALHIIWTDGEQTLPLMPKTQLARELMTLIIKRFYAKNSIKNS
ncbi:MAG: bifunctional phosphopantothenoylcysteine decarboxylase/phosphopantothenate--cysteine ligase CoaBC [Pseudomonadota bacterium]|uniref:bifunctional phosphopantothenoylcysteine decarboxylase/phosphopantothenate--cysteine ligase CoaBC n=1 Tax=Methylophaga aminisulfidivorans TaxID=230105 RepID=UPI0024E1AB02|nr:bifunctional phosphopantothenoylcysteine decarboxylase/phosphopantothenate--cysteine ligase CoaBC [Methylophaga aminisulfidivorans]MEC9411630.1 bifunctional phosphopantothenoylcysteine decarboxylase/phosphopantothenate--cysteine ligase CoaBC [Pseudomonadota bacterium]